MLKITLGPVAPMNPDPMNQNYIFRKSVAIHTESYIPMSNLATVSSVFEHAKTKTERK